MRKTSKTARITILLLVLCLISTAMLSGTFAKYTSEYAGADTALIAKWDISVSDGETYLSPEETVNLDLFSHAYNTNIITGAGDDKIIAPGVGGEFTLKVENKGDVAAEITFEFGVDDTSTAADAPIEYKLEGGEWGDLADLMDELNGTSEGLGDPVPLLTVAAENGTAEQIVEWRWPFDGSEVHDTDDVDDTELGKASANGASRSTYILNVTATATQIEPGTTP
ncbi:MAG: hypothetical protein RJR37_07240 [Peptococcaceae bacterium MAG4]|nr:hypothetical protein [Peptococcaceae bacterium MAG4]